MPRLLFENPFYRDWDIHPDGSRFVVVVNQSEPVSNNELTEVYIVTNWFTELHERMGEN